MNNEPDLTRQELHFEFGKNWAAYAEKISEVEIGEAIGELDRLLDNEQLDCKRFLDIGSGSGLQPSRASVGGAGSSGRGYRSGLSGHHSGGVRTV